MEYIQHTKVNFKLFMKVNKTPYLLPAITKDPSVAKKPVILTHPNMEMF